MLQLHQVLLITQKFCILYYELVQSGLYNICRTKLRCQKVAEMQKNIIDLPCRRYNSEIATILFTGKYLLVFFNNDPEVINLGYIRLVVILSAYTFSILYDLMSGDLRGFGISLVPAILTIIGVCGVRIAWIAFVFTNNQTFQTILTAYPVSLWATAVMIAIALFCYHPINRFIEK